MADQKTADQDKSRSEKVVIPSCDHANDRLLSARSPLIERKGCVLESEKDQESGTGEALRKARELARKFQDRFSPVLAQLNTLLFEANQQGIDVSIEIAQCEGYMSVHAIASGVATPAGQLLARRRGLIP